MLWGKGLVLVGSPKVTVRLRYQKRNGHFDGQVRVNLKVILHLFGRWKLIVPRGVPRPESLRFPHVHCLRHCFAAVKIHHGQANSHKGNHLIGALLTVSEASTLSSQWGHGSTHGNEEVAKSSTS